MPSTISRCANSQSTRSTPLLEEATPDAASSVYVIVSDDSSELSTLMAVVTLRAVNAEQMTDAEEHAVPVFERHCFSDSVSIDEYLGSNRLEKDLWIIRISIK